MRDESETRVRQERGKSETRVRRRSVKTCANIGDVAEHRVEGKKAAHRAEAFEVVEAFVLGDWNEHWPVWFYSG